jgi:hypothetical protein
LSTAMWPACSALCASACGSQIGVPISRHMYGAASPHGTSLPPRSIGYEHRAQSTAPSAPRKRPAAASPTRAVQTTLPEKKRPTAWDKGGGRAVVEGCLSPPGSKEPGGAGRCSSTLCRGR